ncbi:YtxH domain-containing protein [Alkaliphilus hydrothermalis]|uniref:Gas vesicle protein n=1 Tax=Alkaliphilus hydrothermalis TaxID=1482730 RepID=A0ABS2NTN4_9FIRM|nr:YtxH domain-containing protein [Alkaliphilus hydrothermalis]MBM7616291.1 gas vesicle protein [Alkaliphilus hydrothermalis]
MNRKDIKQRVDYIKSLLDPETAKRQKRKERSRGLAKGLAVGTLLGGIAGVFFAPDKGENTRMKAKGELDKAKDVLETNFQEGKSKLSNIVESKKGFLKDGIVVVKDKNNSHNIFVEEEDLLDEELEKEEA